MDKQFISKDMFLINQHLLTNKETVYSWLELIEGKVGVAPELGTKRYCSRGMYQTVVWSSSGDIFKDEGKPAETFHTPEMAWKMWALAFWLYHLNRGGKIYWRHKPELDTHIQKVSGIKPQDLHMSNWEITSYIVYARVFIDFVFIPPTNEDVTMKILHPNKLVEVW